MKVLFSFFSEKKKKFFYCVETPQKIGPQKSHVNSASLPRNSKNLKKNTKKF